MPLTGGGAPFTLFSLQAKTGNGAQALALKVSAEAPPLGIVGDPVSFSGYLSAKGTAIIQGAVLRLAQGQPWLHRLARGRYASLAWLGWAALRLWPGTGPWAAVGVGSQGAWLALADFLTIGWLLHRPAAGRCLGLTHPAVQWVGQRSYSIYLYHLPLLVFWQRLVYHLVPAAAGRATLLGPLPVLLVLGPVLALLSAASWQWIEAPIDRFKNRFRYAGTEVAKAASEPLSGSTWPGS